MGSSTQSVRMPSRFSNFNSWSLDVAWPFSATNQPLLGWLLWSPCPFWKSQTVHHHSSSVVHFCHYLSFSWTRHHMGLPKNRLCTQKYLIRFLMLHLKKNTHTCWGWNPWLLHKNCHVSSLVPWQWPSWLRQRRASWEPASDVINAPLQRHEHFSLPKKRYLKAISHFGMY